MDKTQLKLVELSENITALEICLNNGLIDFSDLILYLQYDIPIEENNDQYSKLKKCFKDRKDANRYTNDERNEAVKAIMRRLQRFIIKIDKNGSKSRYVYKQANDIAEQICNRLDKEYFSTSSNLAPYSKKAATV